MPNYVKVAVVTGASSEIGLSVVKSLLSTEYLVVAQVNSNKKALSDLEGSYNLKIVQHDLSQADRAKEFIDQVASEYSRIDVLINTIGPLLLKNLDEISPVEWQEQIHFNLNLSFYLCHFSKNYLIKTKGHIINFTFSGVEFLKARVDSTSYCAAKAGLVILTKSFASLLAPHGIRVNSISPGLVESSQTSNEERQKMAETVPFGRPGFPSEVAEILVWLLTKSPTYLTGASIPIAGAWEYL